MWTDEKPTARPAVPRSGANSRHRLGFAVKVLGEGGLPSHDARRWSSGPHLRHSLERLRAIFAYLDRHDIRMYRMATALAPYASHPDLPQFHRQIDECEVELAEAGAIARSLDLRLSSHPGQYTVLNSETPEVRDKAIADVEVQAALFDAMGLGDEAVVVLGLADATGLRVVWDALHHRCQNAAGIGEGEALRAALATWRGRGVPKVHYSSPRLDVREAKVRRGRRVERRYVMPQLRAHADLVDPIGFERFLADAPREDFDVMIEAKAKDLALLRLRDQLAERGIAREAGRLVVGDSDAGGRIQSSAGS